MSYEVMKGDSNDFGTLGGFVGVPERVLLAGARSRVVGPESYNNI